MADIATLIFLLGQLGMSLGLGAATFSLMFHFVAAADGTIDAAEARFVAATRTVIAVSLFLIVITGALVTGAHILAGERDIVVSPIYLGKWALIGILILAGILRRLRLISLPVAGVISGASWYALFIVHTLAPTVSWAVLSVGYGLWVLAFSAGYILVQKASLESTAVLPPKNLPAPRPVPQSVKPAPAAPLPQVHKVALPMQPRPIPSQRVVPQAQPHSHSAAPSSAAAVQKTPPPPIDFSLNDRPASH